MQLSLPGMHWDNNFLFKSNKFFVSEVLNKYVNVFLKTDFFKFYDCLILFLIYNLYCWLFKVFVTFIQISKSSQFFNYSKDF